MCVLGVSGQIVPRPIYGAIRKVQPNRLPYQNQRTKSDEWKQQQPPRDHRLLSATSLPYLLRTSRYIGLSQEFQLTIHRAKQNNKQHSSSFRQEDLLFFATTIISFRSRQAWPRVCYHGWQKQRESRSVHTVRQVSKYLGRIRLASM